MENSKKAIVILAGGLGSRYQGLKQIDGILPNSATLLEYSIFDAIKAGFNKIVFIINESIPESYIDRLSGILTAENVKIDFSEFISSNPENTAEIYLPAVIDSLIQNKEVEVSVEVSSEQWKGVTYAEDKAELQEFLKQKIANHIYTEDLWN